MEPRGSKIISDSKILKDRDILPPKLFSKISLNTATESALNREQTDTSQDPIESDESRDKDEGNSQVEDKNLEENKSGSKDPGDEKPARKPKHVSKITNVKSSRRTTWFKKKESIDKESDKKEEYGIEKEHDEDLMEKRGPKTSRKPELVSKGPNDQKPRRTAWFKKKENNDKESYKEEEYGEESGPKVKHETDDEKEKDDDDDEDVEESDDSSGRKTTHQRKTFDERKPKKRAGSDAMKDIYIEPQLPDISSKGIIVDKGGTQSGENLMGQKGFVSDLLLEVISDEKVKPLEISKSKPVSKQSLTERRSTRAVVESDIQSGFEKKPGSRRLSLFQSKKSSKGSLAPISGTRIESKTSDLTKSETLPPDLNHLKSRWQPGVEEEEVAPLVGFHRRKQSWMGQYVEGTDYWSKKDPSEETQKVEFGMDERSQTWYDIPINEEVLIDIPLDARRTVPISKIEALKMRPLKEQVQSSGQENPQPFSFDEREPMPEKISCDLYQMFVEFCKSDDLSSARNRLSLLNADKCLEQVGLLDHKKLTMIHTGFCFKACGGSRYRGLTFPEFKIFIEMVAETRKMPVFDFVNRLKLGYAGIITIDEG